MAIEPTEIDKLKEALRLSLAYSADLGWALDAQQAVNAQLCKEISGLEWLLRTHRVQVFWHIGTSHFVVGKWQYRGDSLGKAIALAVAAYKEQT